MATPAASSGYLPPRVKSTWGSPAARTTKSWTTALTAGSPPSRVQSGEVSGRGRSTRAGGWALDDVLAGRGDDGDQLVGFLLRHVVLLEHDAQVARQCVELRIGDGHALMHGLHGPSLVLQRSARDRADELDQEFLEVGDAGGVEWVLAAAGEIDLGVARRQDDEVVNDRLDRGLASQPGPQRFRLGLRLHRAAVAGVEGVRTAIRTRSRTFLRFVALWA